MTTAKPAEPQEPEATVQRDEDEKLKTVREEYPEIVSPLLDTIEELRARLEKVEAPVRQFGQSQADHVKQSEYAKLEAVHPDWKDYANDDRFGGWLETQPRAVQEAAARNQDVSDGVEAAWVLGMFKDAVSTNSTATIAERRNKQMDASRDAGRAGTQPTTATIPDDFDAAMAHFAAKADKKRQQYA